MQSTPFIGFMLSLGAHQITTIDPERALLQRRKDRQEAVALSEELLLPISSANCMNGIDASKIP